jgi:acylphosphatase
VRVHVVVSGLVQGVGFRYFALREARRLGLTGFVRNLPDRRVEIVAEGDQGALETFVAAMREGPQGSIVRDVRVGWTDEPAGEREFSIR